MPSEFEIQRERSKVYEIAFGRYLERTRSYWILPSYDYSGLANNKAPRLTCVRERLVIPDLLGFKAGLGGWFEIKLKAHADFYRKTQTWETGLPYRHWQDYQRVNSITGFPVWLIFIHEKENVVKFGNVKDMPISHVYEGSKMDRNGTIFFKFQELKTVMPLSKLQEFVLPADKAA